MLLNQAWWAVPNLQQTKGFSHLRRLILDYFSDIQP